MPAFTDTYPDGGIPLILTEDSPGLVKSPYEELDRGPAGQPDRATFYYDGFFASWATAYTALATFSAGTGIASEAGGTWYSEGRAKIASPKEEMPFARIAVPCIGLAASKPDATRWFAVTESQGAENVVYDSTLWPRLQAEILSVGVEIDKILLTSPNMSDVGSSATPPSAPSVRASDWTSIENPTRHYPDGWFIADIRASRLAGGASLWFATYVYRYKYPYSP